MPTEVKFSAHPEASRLFVQKSAGSPWHWIGCVSVRNVQLKPRQLEFTRCVGANGVAVATLPRYPNPTQFDVSFQDNFAKWQSMHRGILNGCSPNFLLASAQCRNADKVGDVYYNDNGVLLSGVDAATAYSYYNNTAIFADPNQAVAREDQIGFIFTEGTWVRDYAYGLQAIAQYGDPASPINIDSIAVVDHGSCADVVCQPCDAEGCQQLLVNDGVHSYVTLDGGSTWAMVTSSGAGQVQAYKGTGFIVQATAIYLKNPLDATVTLASWTQATTDVAFTTLSTIAFVDPKLAIIGGVDGAVWRSTNGGGNWKSIRAAVASTVGYYDFKTLAWNEALQQLVGVSVDGTDVYIQVSNDKGKTWATVGIALTGKSWAGSSKAVIFNSGASILVLVDGDLYRVNCVAGAVSYTKLVITGASGDITGVGSFTEMGRPNAVDGNIMFLTVWDGVTAKIYRTVDAFNSYELATLPLTIPSGDDVTNPVSSCSNQFGDSVYFAFNSNIYYGRDWESFFSEE